MYFAIFFGLVSEKTKKDSYTIDIRIYVWYNNLGTFNSWVIAKFLKGKEAIKCLRKIC